MYAWEAMTGLTALGWLIIWPVFWKNIRKISLLPEAPANFNKSSHLPLVSVIITAKDEERSIQDTIQYLMNQDYPRMEMIAINDRSMDRTGTKLDDLKVWSDTLDNPPFKLKVIHITTLPEGWLGKNHALYHGAKHANGSLLLFTDADIHFAPNTISRAVHAMMDNEADHVSLLPKMVSKSFLLHSFVQYFLFSLMFVLRPWRANNDQIKSGGLGIGAFQLIRRSAYSRIGTHRALAMYPDDDLQLGNLVKQCGLKQRIFSAWPYLSVEWYPNLTVAVRGLEKNLFAGFGYRIRLVLLASFVQIACFGLPWLFVWTWPIWLVYGHFAILIGGLLASGLMVLTYGLQGTIRPRPGWKELLAIPISCFILVYILLRTTLLAIVRGGVYWRGTYYSLKKLKEGRKK